MYIVLIEAGGLSQMARIHAAWQQRFLQGLEEVLSRHRFKRTRAEGDILFFSGSNQDLENSTPLMLDAIRGTLAYLRSHGDTLLDYLILLGYDRHGDSVAGSRALAGILPGVRETNALYMTGPVFQMLEPMVEAVPVGSLFRLATLRSDTRSSLPTFREALARPASVGELGQLVSDGSGRKPLWIWGPDRSVTTATVQSALEHEGIPPITVQCMPGMSRVDFERALISELPDLPAFSPLEEEAEFEHTLTVLRTSLRNPGAMYLSAGWMETDLSMVSAHVIQRFLQSESQRLLFIADYDLLGLPQSEILAVLPGTVTVGPLVVSGNTPPTDENWKVAHVPADHTGALNFWCGIGDNVPEQGGRTVDEAAAALTRALTLKHRRVLYLATRGTELLDSTLLDRLYSILDITPVERSRILSDLDRIGLVAGLDPLRLQPAAEDLLESLLSPEERRYLLDELGRFLLEEERSGSIYPTESLWAIVAESSRSDVKDRFFHRMIHFLAAGGDRRGMERVLAGMSTGLTDETPPSVCSARVRLSLRQPSLTDDCTRDVLILSEAVRREAGSRGALEYADDYLLSLAEYHLSRRDYSQALDCCKKAILLGQDLSGDENGIESRGAGQLLMARIALSQRRLRDAMQYLGFAREDAAEDPATLLTARMLEAIGLFLHGNLTRAESDLQQLLEPLLETGFTEALLFTWFLQARIQFELGRYDQARTRLALLLRYARESDKGEPTRVALSWVARSLLQTDPENQAAREMLTGGEVRPESLLFLGEAMCRAGEFANALSVLTEACTLEAREERRPRLGLCWENGFASVEDLIIAYRTGTSELLRIATAYRGWALAETGSMDEAVALFFDLTRGNGGIGDDPYTGLYNYLYASILPRERSPDRDDSRTVLGKAVKLIQERTSRIDDHRDKRRYLTSNVWNERIMAAARSHNLA
ncbi:MAG: hypothetical protein EA427_12600 [Spirochaetaceae bacterium]|nr:MAG: hypothetical protein EA427_12600 [Spirochaetaceae bacterium]